MRKFIIYIVSVYLCVLCMIANAQPVASFIAQGVNGDCKKMTFYDSTGCNNCSISNYNWDFGDGGSSSVQSPSHSYLANGTYTVTLTVFSNTGSSYTTSKTVQIPHQNCVVVAISGYSGSCFGTDSCVTLQAVASNSISPYHYTWNNGLTTSSIRVCSVGTYTVQVRSYNNRLGSATINVSNLPTHLVSSRITNANCDSSNGSININVTGNSTGFTYLWNNGDTTSSINNIAEGSYSVTINDTGNCTQSFTYTIVDSCGNIYGKVFFDENSNGVLDVNEIPFTDGSLQTTGGFIYQTEVASNGSFNITSGNGNRTTRFIPFQNYYTVTPNYHVSQINNSNDSINFAVKPTSGNPNLQITIVPLVPARPGFNTFFQIIVKNIGTEVLSGSACLIKPSNLTIVSSSPIYSDLQNDTIFWNYSNLQPGHSKIYYMTLGVPSTVNIGTVLCFNSIVFPVQNDVQTYNNYYNVCLTVSGSYDPNDIWVNHDTLTTSQISQGEYLEYRIRFQNTGTDTAFTVSVIDTLDDNLDWTSLQMINASHSYKLIKRNGNSLEWLFENIMLTDTATNEAESNGYIFFRIKPKSTLSLGDSINNTAGIYFDFNPPIITNTTYTEVLEPLFVNKQKTDNLFGIYPNPANTYLYVDYKNTTPQTILQISDVLGNVVKQQRLQKEIDIKDIANGVYFVKVMDGNKVNVAKFLKE